MTAIIQRSLYVNIRVMKIIGFYNFDHFLYRFYSIVIFCLFTCFFPLLGHINLIMSKKTSLNLTPCFLADVTGFVIKFSSFLVKRRKIHQCIYYFNDFTPKGAKEKEIINDAIRICQRNSLVYFIGVLCTLTVILVPGLIFRQFGLPVDAWLPYDPFSDLKIYYSTYVFFILAMLYNGFGGTIIDTLIGGLAYHATNQLKILKYKLKNAKSSKNLYEDLVTCAKHYQTILCFVKEYENCFSWIVFSQFAGTVFTVGYFIVALLLAPINGVFIAVAVMSTFCALFQILFYCYYGQLLFEENNTLRDAIYLSAWYNFDQQSKKILITIMERAKIPMFVTAGKILDLSLETFTKVLKTIYSVAALLQKMQ